MRSRIARWAARGALALVLTGPGGCALVFDYGDYGDTQATTGTAGGGGLGGSGGTGGSGGQGGTGLSGGGGQAGGAGGTGGCALAKEIPLNDVDEDCDGAAAGHPLWHARFGDMAPQALSGVAADAAGNVLLAGFYDGTLDIGGGEKLDPPATAAPDMFVAKLGPGGEPLWIRNGLGHPTPRQSTAVAVDAGGGITVVGHFTDPSRDAEADGFVLSLDADGTERWVENFGGPLADMWLGVAAGQGGDAHVVGRFRGTIDLAGTPHVSAGDADDIVYAKYDLDGNVAWSGSFGGEGIDVPWAVAVDPAGDMYITGEYRGAPPGLPEIGTAPAFSAIFVMKVLANGAPKWAKGFPAAVTLGNARGLSIAVDREGNVLVTGALYGSTQLGPGAPLPYTGGSDVFVAKLEPTFGEVQWARSYGDGADQLGTSVAAAEDGSIFVAGTFTGSMDVDPDAPGSELVAQAGQDLFLIKLNGSGKPQWSARFAPAEAPEARTVRLATHAGHVLLSGGWVGGLDFGTAGTSPPHGDLDVFAAKLTQ